MTNPLELFAILYLAITAYNIDYAKPEHKEIEKMVVCLLIFIFISCELILSINRVDYQVFEFDNKIKMIG